MPLLRRTRAILRKAEFGFLGVVVVTRVHTPRFWGAPLLCRRRRICRALKVYCKAGALLLLGLGFRPFRTSWLMVDKLPSSPRPLGHIPETALNEATEPCHDGLAPVSHITNFTMISESIDSHTRTAILLQKWIEVKSPASTARTKRSQAPSSWRSLAEPVPSPGEAICLDRLLRQNQRCRHCR